MQRRGWYRFNKFLWKLFGIEEKPSMGPRYSTSAGSAARIRHNFATRMAEHTAWITKTKAEHPVVYFLTETLHKKYRKYISAVEDAFTDKVYWFENYAIDRADIIRTSLKRGEHSDNSEKILSVNFQILVDHIEKTLAASYISRQASRVRLNNPAGFNPACDMLNTPITWEKLEKKMVWHKWTRLTRYRSAALGLAHLHDYLERMNLEDEEDGRADTISTLETLVLYVWWTQVRPNRKDTEDEVGLSKFRTDMVEKYGDDYYRTLDINERVVYRDLLTAEEELMTAQFAEDNDMLLRLIKHRDNF